VTVYGDLEAMLNDMREHVFHTGHRLVDASDPMLRMIGFSTEGVEPPVTWQMPLTKMKMSLPLAQRMQTPEDRQAFADSLAGATDGQ